MRNCAADFRELTHIHLRIIRLVVIRQAVHGNQRRGRRFITRLQQLYALGADLWQITTDQA